MWRPVLIAALLFTAGVAAQDQSKLLTTYFNPEIKVFSDPYWYTITRQNATINYQAKGKRLIECTYKAPLTADLLDKYGNIVSRELVRRIANRKYNQVNEVADDGTIIGVLKVSPEPREFQVNNYIIVTDVQTLEAAVEFIIRTECFNANDGRVPANFGPFPIPPDGKSVSSFNLSENESKGTK